MKKSPVFFAGVLIVCLVLSSTLPALAMPAAPTFTVNSTADVAGVAGDTVCETAPGDGVCTLRAAIMAANHLPGGGATVMIPAGIYSLTISPVGTDDEASGDLNVTQNMSIQGAGASWTIIDASGLVPGDRVIHVIGAKLTLSTVTIRNGSLVNNSGAGIRLDDSSSSVHAMLTLNDSLVSNNTITASTAGGKGGGIFGNSGAITINRSSVSNNLIVVSQNTNFVFGVGAGIVQGPAGLTLNQSILNANEIISPLLPVEGGGSAIDVYGPSSILDSTINGNIANTGIGAILNDSTLTILNSTVSNNNSSVDAGGIVNLATLAIINSTISGNTTNGNGGGLFNCGNPACTANLYNVTIASNTAGVAKTGGGIYNEAGGMVHFQNTILSGNRAHTFSGTPPFYPDDCNGSLVSAGYNLIETSTGCTISGLADGNQIGVIPDLGPLQANGGLTQTQALLPGSPAIAAGNPTGCKDNLGAALTTDQRGYPREVYRAGQMRCDIGAYQTQLTLFLPFLRK